MQTDNYIDYEDGLKRVGGNDAFYKRLLGKFAGADHLSPIITAVSHGDFEQAARDTHTLKGVSANLSLKALYTASIELETLLKNGRDHTGSLENLKSVLSGTLNCINEL